jgi:hypothetical protein
MGDTYDRYDRYDRLVLRRSLLLNIPSYLPFHALQVPEVQVHEPYLTTTRGASLQREAAAVYSQLGAQGVTIHLATFYDDLGE